MPMVVTPHGGWEMPDAPARLLWRAKMQRISEVLQLPIIIEGGWVFALELQPLEERDFLRRRIATEGRLLEEGCQPRLLVARIFRVLFYNRKLLQVLGHHPAV